MQNYSKVKIGSTPVHVILVTFPIAFYTAAFASYIAYYFGQDPFIFRMAVVANIAGVGTAILAALFGFIDWAFGIPRRTLAKRVGVLHMFLNILSLAFFTTNALLQSARWNDFLPLVDDAILLSGFGLAFTLMAGFLGGTLVFKHRVGVEEGPVTDTTDVTPTYKKSS